MVSLVVKILAPLLVGVPDHAHDVAAGVQGEWPGFAHELHVWQFVEKKVAFAAIAGMTAGDQVLPGGQAAAGTRVDVIEGELAGGEDDAAVLAGIAITEKDVFAREGAGLVRDATVTPAGG